MIKFLYKDGSDEPVSDLDTVVEASSSMVEPSMGDGSGSAARRSSCIRAKTRPVAWRLSVLEEDNLYDLWRCIQTPGLGQSGRAASKFGSRRLGDPIWVTAI
ncbi:hypothetical protein M6B38_123450 [Iris pallida]|uniref:Uncharacterized protein n=1 Tax=Iris pallida TaxID=29817 RepID=A0AAX6H1X2_IRIPA|nr:hypothetical protein M6B38_123450 [Iris pallida]